MAFLLGNKLANPTMLGMQLMRLMQEAYDDDASLMDACLADLQVRGRAEDRPAVASARPQEADVWHVISRGLAKVEGGLVKHPSAAGWAWACVRTAKLSARREHRVRACCAVRFRTL